MLYPDSLKTFNFITDELENTIILPFYCPGFEFNRETNEAIFRSFSAGNWKDRKTLEYFYYNFDENQFSEIFNINEFITGDSLEYTYTFDIYFHFIKFIYNNNLLVSINIELDDGTPFEYLENHIGLFDGETHKLLYKKEIELTDDCRNDISNDGKYLAVGNTTESNVAFDILSLEDSLKVVKSFPGELNWEGLLEFTDDGKFILSGLKPGLTIWDLNDNQNNVYKYENRFYGTYQHDKMDISTNNQYIATFTFDNYVGSGVIELLKGHFYPSGVEEDKSEIDMQIMPNPAQNELNISAYFDSPENIKIRINDITGNEIYQEEIGIVTGDFSHSIDSGIFPAGTYFLQLITNNYSFSEKFVIER